MNENDINFEILFVLSNYNASFIISKEDFFYIYQHNIEYFIYFCKVLYL